MFVVIALFISVITLILILLPFFSGQGGALASAAAESSPETLHQVKEAIVKRYLSELAAFENKQFTKRTWQARQRFLQNRYVDVARRLDYIQHMQRTLTEEAT